MKLFKCYIQVYALICVHSPNQIHISNHIAKCYVVDDDTVKLKKCPSKSPTLDYSSFYLLNDCSAEQISHVGLYVLAFEKFPAPVVARD